MCPTEEQDLGLVWTSYGDNYKPSKVHIFPLFLSLLNKYMLIVINLKNTSKPQKSKSFTILIPGLSSNGGRKGLIYNCVILVHPRLAMGVIRTEWVQGKLRVSLGTAVSRLVPAGACRVVPTLIQLKPRQSRAECVDSAC